MNTERLKCSICGTVFNNNELDEYAAHVHKCASNESMRRKTEDMKKINQELEDVKRAKVVYEGLKDQFKEKYPEIYKANFKDDCEGNCKCNEHNDYKDDYKNKYEYEYEVDFNDLRDIVNNLFGYRYSKRND